MSDVPERKAALVTQLIASRYSGLSKGHKKVATFVMENGQRAAFMTLEELAREAGVSRGTAERFARTLGYDGYPQFRRQVAGLLEESLRPLEKVRLGMERRVSPSLALRSVLAEDQLNLDRTLQAIAGDQFERAVELVRAAERVVILGLGASGFLAGLAAHRLGGLRPGVVAVANGGAGLYQRLCWLGERDLLVALSFPRYSRATVEACRYARGRGMGVLALTDAFSSPVYPLATEALLVRCERELLVSSLTAAVGVLDGIVTAVAVLDRGRTLDAMSDVTDQLIEVGEYDVGERAPGGFPAGTPDRSAGTAHTRHGRANGNPELERVLAPDRVRSDRNGEG